MKNVKMKRISTLFVVFVSLTLCLFVANNALSVTQTNLSYYEIDENNIPFKLIVIDNDDTTATLVCFMPDNMMRKLIICKNGTKDYQLISDDTPFIVDLDYEYSIRFKIINDGILYNYDACIIVEKNSNDVVLVSSIFLVNVLHEYDNPIDTLDLSFMDNIAKSLLLTFNTEDSTPGMAFISSPTSNASYIINSIRSYSYSAANATRYQAIVKIITGNPNPDSTNEPGTTIFDIETISTTLNFTIPNNSSHAGLWVKLYVRGINNANVYGLADMRYVQIKPITPTLDNPTLLNGRTVNLSWSSAAGAVSYNVYRSTSANGSYSRIGSTTTRSFADVPGTGTFHYRVAAVAKTTALNDSRILSRGVEGGQSASKSITIPMWTLSRSSITFPAATAGYGQQAAVSTTISNNGPGTLTMVGASITAGSENFEITSSPSISIAAGSSSVVSVSPKINLGTGTHTGTLTVKTDNGGTKTVSLSFTVNFAPPLWTLSRSSITFPYATVGYGQQSAVPTTISNNGPGTLILVGASLTAGSANFETTSSPSSSIAVGSSSFVSVRPKTNLGIGTHNGTLTVTTGNGGRKTISLSFLVYPVTPGAANISSPTSGTIYTINSTRSYSYSAASATKYQTIVRIITGNPDPNNANEPGVTILDTTSTSTTSNFTIANSSSIAGLWVKLYVCGINNEGSYGPADIKYVQIKPLTPTLNDLTQSKNGSTVNLTWSAAAGAATYYIYRSTSASGPYTRIGSTPSTTRSYSDDPGSGTFHYRVSAVAKTTTSNDLRILSRGVEGDQSTSKSIINPAPNTAIKLEINTPTTINITSGARREVKFTTPSAGSYTFISSNRGSLDPKAYSASTGASYLDDDSAGDRNYIFHKELTAGQIFIYYSGVLNDSNVNGNYTVTATTRATGDRYEPNNSMQTATSIANNVTIKDANIHLPTDNDYYKFTLNATSNVNINLSHIPDGCDYDLKLYNSENKQLAFSARAGNNPESIMTALNAGTYYIHVYSYTGCSSSYYHLSLSTTGDIYEYNDTFETAKKIDINSTIYATIHITGDIDFYKLELTDGYETTISLSGIPSGCNYELELYQKQEGNRMEQEGYYLIAESKNMGNISERITKPIQSGTYYIKVYSVNGSSTSYYTLTISSPRVNLPLPRSGYEITFEPDKWNDGSAGTIQRNTNCYAYAWNIQRNPFSNTIGYILQPGELAGIRDDNAMMDKTGKAIVDLCIKDALALKKALGDSGSKGYFLPTTRTAVSPPGYYKIALVLDTVDTNYHFYRQDASGYWSHKTGSSPVVNDDSSYNRIDDPLIANRLRRIVTTVVTPNYRVFVGYFDIKSIPLYSSFSIYQQPDNNARYANIDPTKPPLSKDKISLVHAGMSVEQVIALLDIPHGHYGSGILMDSYNLEDGRILIINYGMYREAVIKVFIIGNNDERIVIVDDYDTQPR